MPLNAFSATDVAPAAAFPFILSKSVSSANILFPATQIKAQQLAHHDRQKKSALAQIKVKEREISEQEGELRRLRGSLEPLKTLWCASQIHWSYPHVAYTVAYSMYLSAAALQAWFPVHRFKCLLAGVADQ
jgi:hypothetical protein